MIDINTIYGRPELTNDMGSKRFLEFYYLDSEMERFLRQNGLDPSGDRNELKNKVASFLSSGKIADSKFMLKPEEDAGIISGDSLIELDFEFGEKHARYYEDVIGPDFVPYEDFLMWLEKNTGKTYGESIEIWYLIRDDIETY